MSQKQRGLATHQDSHPPSLFSFEHGPVLIRLPQHLVVDVAHAEALDDETARAMRQRGFDQVAIGTAVGLVDEAVPDLYLVGLAALTLLSDAAAKAPLLVVTAVVVDPQYLELPFIVSTNFKKEADGSKWDPAPCSATW